MKYLCEECVIFFRLSTRKDVTYIPFWKKCEGCLTYGKSINLNFFLKIHDLSAISTEGSWEKKKAN